MGRRPEVNRAHALRRLLLLGGGHSQVEVLRRFGTRPAPGVEITLVSPARYTPYSGMLPGLVAGHYGYRDCHIDLERLAGFAGARFLQGMARSIEPARRRVMLADGTPIEYDVLSINIGSNSALAGVAGAADYALRAKPVEAFLRAWEALIERARGGSLKRLAVVGAGTAGVELLLAMQYRLACQSNSGATQFTLVTDTRCLLPTHNPRVRAALERILAQRGIEMHFDSLIVRIDPGAAVTANGSRIAADAIVWATGAAAPSWLRDIWFQLDAAGFIAINQYLQSDSYPDVFAAGDCAAMQGHAYPKSGVYAVRQGPVLAENLRRKLAGERLLVYRPQRRALALISSGNRYAVASYGPLALQGAWVWRWKDRIDRRFIANYNMQR